MSAHVTQLDAQRESAEEGHFPVLHPLVDLFEQVGCCATRQRWDQLRADGGLAPRDIDSHVAAAVQKGPHNYDSSAC